MTRIEFELQGLPKRTNNSASSWRARYAEARKWKLAVGEAVIGLKLSSMPWPLAKLTLIRYSSKSPDFDGLVSSFKHAIDGLIEAGVIENDKFENVGQPTYLWEQVGRGKGKIKIIVEEIEHDVWAQESF